MRAKMIRVAAFVVLITILLLMPEAVLFAAMRHTQGGKQNTFLMPVPLCGLWGLLSLWITFDSSTFLRLVKQEADPVGPEAFILAMGGVINLMAFAASLGMGLW